MELLKSATATRRIRIWSAGCSTGEEPYTLAMTLQKAFSASTSIQILATDLDTAVLETASSGIYPLARIDGVDQEWKRLAFLKGKGALEGQVCVRPELRQLITFRQMNFLDEAWPVGTNPSRPSSAGT